MISIGGASFPLRLVAHPVAGRETVLLGVIPIGAVMQLDSRRWWYWSLELPLGPRMQRAPSRAAAQAAIERAVEQWLEAAAVVPLVPAQAAPRGARRARA